MTQHLQRSAVCANLALLEVERNSGYHTAQEGLSFTVVDQPAARPRAMVEANAVAANITRDSCARLKNMQINNCFATTGKNVDTLQDHYETALEDNKSDTDQLPYASDDNDLDGFTHVYAHPHQANGGPPPANLPGQRILCDEFR